MEVSFSLPNIGIYSINLSLNLFSFALSFLSMGWVEIFKTFTKLQPLVSATIRVHGE